MMFNTVGLGKALIFFGATLMIVGMLVTFVGKLPWIGRLPGDICVKKGNFTFYFPLATSILLSALLSLILLFIGRRR